MVFGRFIAERYWKMSSNEKKGCPKAASFFQIKISWLIKIIIIVIVIIEASKILVV
jgi:hypothetical protein